MQLILSQKNWMTEYLIYGPRIIRKSLKFYSSSVVCPVFRFDENGPNSSLVIGLCFSRDNLFLVYCLYSIPLRLFFRSILQNRIRANVPTLCPWADRYLLFHHTFRTVAADPETMKTEMEMSGNWDYRGYEIKFSELPPYGLGREDCPIEGKSYSLY